jgi:L-ornithine N5-monooxygenase
MTRHRDVELLAIGAGPSNLALAIALEELAPAELSTNSLLIEQNDTVAWQRGMLLPWTQAQVSFLKDLVTLRDPRSKFSFLNYLHSVDRLNEFVNLGTFTPYRTEISDYLQWAANTLDRVRVEYGRRCAAIEPIWQDDEASELVGWLTRLSDGSTIRSRYLSIGVGRDAYVPPVFSAIPEERLIHSTRYIPRVAELSKELPYHVAVIGGAQSAAEMLYSVQQDLPNCRPTMVMRSVGLNNYETSKFTNELYYPTFTDEFFNSLPSAREQMLREMHRTNYAGLNPVLLDSLYRQLYQERLAGKQRMQIITMTDITAARLDSNEVLLELTDRRTGKISDLRCDLVLLGTGFVPEMPRLIRRLGDALGLDRIAVTRNYRMITEGPASAACYLQGVNEATHGIADSLLSVLAKRAEDVTRDILSNLVEPELRPDLHEVADAPAPVAGMFIAS